MEPAPIETLSVLRAKSGSQVDDQIYHFKDKAGRDVGLRFDLTVGMTRFVAARKGMKPPVKLASFGGVFRYDEPQHARYRWFYQWDVEIFGDQSIDADAEVMDLSYNLFARLGLRNVTLHVGDRRVVEEYIRKKLGIGSDEKVTEMMRALDKVSKKTERELIGEYEAKGVSESEMRSLLAFGRTKGSPDAVMDLLHEEEGSGHPFESSSDLGRLRDSLVQRGIKNVEYDLSIVRGIDYYTAVVFEVVDGNRPDLGSLCGGGRYDVLPRIFGRPDLAATGAAGGVERIALSLADTVGLPPKNGGRPPSVYVAFTEPELERNAIEILGTIRAANIRAEIGSRGRGLSKQLIDASSAGFRFAVILGRREIERGGVILKDLGDRTESFLPTDRIVGKVADETRAN
jgi:histidyl-tRNA synthetase